MAPPDTEQEAVRLNRDFGVLVYPGTPRLIAAGVESISVLGADRAGHQLSGTMPGDSAVALLGFPDVAEQLDAMIEGNAPVRVKLAGDGSIDTVAVVGEGHTIKTDVNQLPDVVSSLMSSTVTTIRYLSVDSPMSMPLPPELQRAHP